MMNWRIPYEARPLEIMLSAVDPALPFAPLQLPPVYFGNQTNPGDAEMHKVGRTIVVIAFAGLLLVPLALAQPASTAHPKSSSSMDNVIATLWAGKTFDQTAISPDGK